MDVLRIMLIALLAAGFAYSQPKRANRPQPQKPAPIVITAERLFEEALADLEAAKAKYTGKLVRVDGQIRSKSQTDGLRVDFSGIDIRDMNWKQGDMSHSMTAYFKEPEIAYFRYIDVGSRYLFEGIVEFVDFVDTRLIKGVITKEDLTFINFKDCEFITQPKKPKT